MDTDIRLLRYFTAVAAEGNLTRAAERLFISQPALTKQIKQLERQLEVELFTRSRNGMTLTPAGEALASATPAVLASWDEALRETRTAASRAARVLRVGFMSSAANEATQQIVAAFARRRPGWRVDLRQAAWSDPTAGLAAGDVEAALLRLPFPGQDDMRIEVLLTEPRWVALPATHPLAARDQIRFSDLWDEPFVAAPAETGYWRDYWLATSERQGHPVRIGAVTDQPDTWLTAIANGDGIALTPESATRYYARPGITYRPVTGVSPSQVCVAWSPANDTNSAVQDFVRCCLDNKPSQHRQSHLSRTTSVLPPALFLEHDGGPHQEPCQPVLAARDMSFGMIIMLGQRRTPARKPFRTGASAPDCRGVAEICVPVTMMR